MTEKDLVVFNTDSTCGDSCSLPTATSAGCGCATNATDVSGVKPSVLQAATQPEDGLWHKVRGGVMFGVACITSPCCTPLIVPIVLGLLAGTPVAAWLTLNIGWVYGGFTLISVVSLILGLRWYFAHNPGHSNDSATRSVKAETTTTHLE